MQSIFKYENGKSEHERDKDGMHDATQKKHTIETNLMGTNLLPYLLLTENHRTGKTISNSNFHNNFSNVLEKHVR